MCIYKVSFPEYVVKQYFNVLSCTVLTIVNCYSGEKHVVFDFTSERGCIGLQPLLSGTDKCSF